MTYLSQLGWLIVKVRSNYIAKLPSIASFRFAARELEVVHRTSVHLIVYFAIRVDLFQTLAALHEFLNTPLLKQLSLLVMSLVQKSSQPDKQRNGGKSRNTSLLSVFDIVITTLSCKTIWPAKRLPMEISKLKVSLKFHALLNWAQLLTTWRFPFNTYGIVIFSISALIKTVHFAECFIK